MMKSVQIKQSILNKIATYISGVILLFACAQISIPIEPVPITLHTVGIMLIALLYKQRDGLIIYFTYLTCGAVGIPVFAKYSYGIHTLFGATFGYFVGFLGAIYIMNQIKAKLGINSFTKVFINCLIGTIVIYICGVTWLAMLFGIKEAIIVGVVPFILPGIFKSVLLSGLLRAVKIFKHNS